MSPRALDGLRWCRPPSRQLALLFDLRTQAVTEKLENPSLLRKTRKDIARMKTILRERQLEEQKKAK